jgi:hypothetical protein
VIVTIDELPNFSMPRLPPRAEDDVLQHERNGLDEDGKAVLVVCPRNS